MPSIAVRRILLVVGGMGLLSFCAGLSLYLNSQFATARMLLIAANLLVIPLFIYFVVLRSRASAHYRHQQRKRKAQAQRELAALAEVDDLLKTSGVQEQEQD